MAHGVLLVASARGVHRVWILLFLSDISFCSVVLDKTVLVIHIHVFWLPQIHLDWLSTLFNSSDGLPRLPNNEMGKVAVTNKVSSVASTSRSGVMTMSEGSTASLVTQFFKNSYAF